jgi:hypothetical protein
MFLQQCFDKFFSSKTLHLVPAPMFQNHEHKIIGFGQTYFFYTATTIPEQGGCTTRTTGSSFFHELMEQRQFILSSSCGARGGGARGGGARGGGARGGGVFTVVFLIDGVDATRCERGSLVLFGLI